MQTPKKTKAPINVDLHSLDLYQEEIRNFQNRWNNYRTAHQDKIVIDTLQVADLDMLALYSDEVAQAMVAINARKIGLESNTDDELRDLISTASDAMNIISEFMRQHPNQ